MAKVNLSLPPKPVLSELRGPLVHIAHMERPQSRSGAWPAARRRPRDGRMRREGGQQEVASGWLSLQAAQQPSAGSRLTQPGTSPQASGSCALAARA